MAGVNIVSQVVQSTLATLKTVTSVNPDALFYVYTDQDFLNNTDHYTYPIVGVWYEGMASNPSSKGGNGLAATMNISIYVLGAPTTFSKTLEDKHDITLVLDEIRTAFRNTRAPTGHFWEFVSEAPYPYDEDNNFVYIQRWRTNAILTS